MNFSANDRQRGLARALWAAALLIILATAAVLLKIGYLNELPSHTEDAGKILAGAIDVDATYRLPLGYPVVLAPFLAALPQGLAVKALNFLAYLVFLGTAWRWLAAGGGLRPGMGQPTRAAQAGLLAILGAALVVHPYVLLSLSRTNESILAGALVMILVALMTRRPTLVAAVAAGLVMGLLVHVRANSVSMALPLGVWLLWGAGESDWKARFSGAVSKGIAGLVAAVAAFTLLSVAATGHLTYRPTNGGYNLFAATNAFSHDEIVRNQNAEYALRPALAERGIAFEDRNNVPEAQYMGWAKEYAAAHPGEIVQLTALKTMTFFAPRLANANSPAKVVVQYFTAALFWLSLAWTCLVFVRRRRWTDGMLILLVASYALPFMLTNADPRMRFPLDLVFYVQLIALMLEQAVTRVPRLRAMLTQA